MVAGEGIEGPARIGKHLNRAVSRNQNRHFRADFAAGRGGFRRFENLPCPLREPVHGGLIGLPGGIFFPNQAATSASWTGSLRHWRRLGDNAAMALTTAMVAMPPHTTEGTVPSQAAAQPDSTAPH